MGFEQLNGYEEMKNYVEENENVVVSIRPKGGCAICEVYAPHFKAAMERMLEQYGERLKVVIVPIDDKCIERLDVCSPTVIFYKRGKEVDRVVVEQVPVQQFENILEEKTKKLVGGEN